MADYTELKDKIKKHEGYRDHIYLDSLSKRTFGYGHLVLPDDDLVDGKHYPIEVAEEYFDKDFNIAVSDAEKLIGDINITSPTGLPQYKKLSGINLAERFWNNLLN